MAYPYKRLKIKGKCIDRHRLVMEEKLGRKLESWEIVHHKDEDKSNDEANNLELRTRSTHIIDHLPKPIVMTEEVKQKISISKQGSKNPRAILTEEQVIRIKKDLGEGMGVRSLARTLNIDHKIISDIKTGKTWKHVVL